MSRASCSVHLVPRGKNLLRFSKMFQVLLQYFEDRFASFYVVEPLSNYQDLFSCVRKAVPFVQGVDNQQIVISYKDRFLQTFINIDRNESTREYSTNSTTSGVGNRICSQYWILLEAIIQLLLQFVSGLNRTSQGQLFSPLSQTSLYNYIAC